MVVVLELPRSLRGELKDPLGPIFTDVDTMLKDVTGPIIAVGDIVTYHLLEADRRPDVALIDGKTKRESIDREIQDAIGGFDHQLSVENPAATLTDELLAALDDAIGREGNVVITVTDGEEDLAALPAILASPDGAGIVYGQPDEGMVLATVDDDLRTFARELMERMDGDTERALTILNL
ncbi:MAG: GTP-dependent dephospho-CoA kinase family protein [Natronomonas sp.]